MGINKNFVVRNGLEVDNDLIFADPDINRVGIGTTILTHTLTINGTISAIGASFSDVSIGSSINLQSLNADSGSINNLNIVNSNNSGVSTFNDITINGLLSAGSSEGVSGQYLVHTGTGVTWVSANISQFIKTTDTQTASEGQTNFSTVYNDEYIDVYLNGVKLSSTEYTANDGLTVVLDTGAFAGDTIEFVSYNNIQTLATSSFNNINVSGIATIGNTVIGSGTTELIVDGDARITGILTIGTSSITLDGTTNSINVGSGVTIDGSTGTINATSINVSGSPLSIDSLSDVNTSSLSPSNGQVLTWDSDSGLWIPSNTNDFFDSIIVTGIATIGNTVIGSGTTELIVDGDCLITGSVTAVGGFISAGNTTPIQVSLSGNQLTFSAAGIGSTTFTLS